MSVPNLPGRPAGLKWPRSPEGGGGRSHGWMWCAGPEPGTPFGLCGACRQARATPRKVPAGHATMEARVCQGGSLPAQWLGAAVILGGLSELHRGFDGEPTGSAGFSDLVSCPTVELIPPRCDGRAAWGIKGVRADTQPRSPDGALTWPDGCGIYQRPLFPLECHIHLAEAATVTKF
jgi:hypothetical protein